MIKTLMILFIQLIVASSFCRISQGQATNVRNYSDIEWNCDLDSMYGFMRKTHPDLYWKTPQKEFDNLIREIKSNIPYFTDNEIITSFSKLVSRVGDGHTTLLGSKLSDKYFPVRIEYFKDGYFVTAVSVKYSFLYGARVLKIGNYSSEKAFEITGNSTIADNKWSKLYWTPRNLMMSSFLNGLRIIDNTDILTLQISDINGKIKTVEVTGEAFPFPDDQFHMWFWNKNSVPDTNYLNILTETCDKDILRLKNSDKPYWFEFLEDFNTLYFCFNSCENSSSDPFPEFIDRLWKAVEIRKPEKLIIDLRNNFGGTNDYLKPLMEGIISHDQFNQKGHLFVMISRKTFSAAMHCASWIEKSAHPVFVGEPTGAAPNHYADPYVYNLPNSDLYLLVSSKYWQNSFPDDKREWIEPELKVEVDSKEYFNGKDLALEYILDYAQKKK